MLTVYNCDKTNPRNKLYNTGRLWCCTFWKHQKYTYHIYIYINISYIYMWCSCAKKVVLTAISSVGHFNIYKASDFIQLLRVPAPCHVWRGSAKPKKTWATEPCWRCSNNFTHTSKFHVYIVHIVYMSKYVYIMWYTYIKNRISIRYVFSSEACLLLVLETK